VEIAFGRAASADAWACLRTLSSDLIQEGLLTREQMAYYEKLRRLKAPASEGPALLDLVPDVARRVKTQFRHRGSSNRPNL